MRMLVENTNDQTTADPGLLRIVARAHEIQERLVQNTGLTVHAIASQERVSANYVYRLLRLPTLAPDIITAIVNGKNPPQLTAKRLMRLTPQKYRSTGLNSGSCSAFSHDKSPVRLANPLLVGTTSSVARFRCAIAVHEK
jgi:hypothetical protein